MKRFITYLYDYKNGMRNKNTGFVRVDIRGKEVRLEIHICNGSTCGAMGKIYLLIKKDDIWGVCIGETKLADGTTDVSYSFSYSNIQDSGADFSNSIGIAIRFENGYMASSWQSEDCKEVESGKFPIWEPNATSERKEMICLEVDDNAVENEIQLEEQPKEHLANEIVTYEKIQLTEMESLPPKYRYLCTNSFLIHGFFNYQYLVKKIEKREGEEKVSIGVPGIFEQPEKMIAGMFGFMEFEALYENEEEIEKKETNQEQKEGTFGAWFVKLTK